MANIIKTLAQAIFGETASAGIATPDAGQAVVGVDATTKKLYSKDDEGNVTNYGEGGGGGASPIPFGRLTLATGTPITATDQTAKTTIYYTPYNGNIIELYDGSAWNSMTFSEISVSVPATTSTPFDIFAYDNSGTVALETVNWTSGTARATSITLQDGRLVKSGAATRLYLGTGRTTTTSGQTEDSESKRLLFNYYHRIRRKLKKVGTGNWTYATATWRPWNNDANNKIEIMVGYADTTLDLILKGSAYNATAVPQAAFGLDFDGTTVGNDADLYGYMTQQAANADGIGLVLYDGYPTLGYHYITMMEYAGNTCVFSFGDGSTKQQGLLGGILC